MAARLRAGDSGTGRSVKLPPLLVADTFAGSSCRGSEYSINRDRGQSDSKIQLESLSAAGCRVPAASVASRRWTDNC